MEKIYDVIIIGGGPAGLTAAIYALRNGKSVMIIEKSVFGGQIVNSPRVENIPGFECISGDEFGDKMLEQVMKLGGEINFDEAMKARSNGETVEVSLDIGGTVKGKTLILATGTTHRRLGLENEEGLIGKSIHFCAVCDGNFYKDRTVVMIGGGNSAFVDTVHLSDICEKIIMLQDLPFFTAEQKLQDVVFSKPNIELHKGTKILEYEMNEGKLTGVRYLENGEEKTAECDGVFLAVGLIPDNGRFAGLTKLDDRGYFISDELGTSDLPNVFIAGDCRTKALRQVATACSDGANAATRACQFLSHQ